MFLMHRSLLVSPHIIWVIKSRIKMVAVRVAHIEGRGGEVHTTFWWGNPREDFGRSRLKCEDNIKMDLQEIR